jgi:hypothetical protein
VRAYLRRLWPIAWPIAKVLLVLGLIRFVFELLEGDVRGGSAANIALRIVAAPAILFATAFAVASILDWHGRYLERKGSSR